MDGLNAAARRGLRRLRKLQLARKGKPRKDRPMNRVDAHGCFVAMQTRGDVSRWPDDFRGLLDGPIAMTALAEVSGQFGDAKTEADLLDAAAHGDSLLSAGVVTVAEWIEATKACARDMLAWGDRIEGQLGDAAAQN
jgi:hypothetical protein